MNFQESSVGYREVGEKEKGRGKRGGEERRGGRSRRRGGSGKKERRREEERGEKRRGGEGERLWVLPLVRHRSQLRVERETSSSSLCAYLLEVSINVSTVQHNKWSNS